MAEVASGVHVVRTIARLTGAERSLGLLVGATLTLIDAGDPGAWTEVRAYLDSIGRRPQDITRIVVTHRHFDHAGGLFEAKEATGAVVAAGAEDIPYIDGRIPHPVKPEFKAAYAELRPVDVEETLVEGQHLAGFEGFEVLAVPGHTAGHLALYNRTSGILFAGDLLRLDEGRVAGPIPEYTEDLAVAHASVRRLAGLDFGTLVTYHGGVVAPNAGKKVRELVASLRP